MDAWTTIVGEITFANRPGAFDAFIKQVNQISKTKPIVFGLEDTRGHGRNLALYLVKNQYMVKSVDAAYTSYMRNSAPTVFKTDGHDAYCVAKNLRDKYDALPDANHDDLYWTIRQLVKRRDALAKSTMQLRLQLHGQLTKQYPSYRKFFTVVTCPTALYFWEQYPSPMHLAHHTAETLTRELKQIGKGGCTMHKVQTILALIEADRDLKKEYQTERDFIVQSIVREIKFKKTAIQDVDEQLANIIPQTGYQLETMPGINLTTASRIISEIGDVNRFANADKLARFAGIAPVIFASGGKGKEQRSRQGNRVLNATLYFLAVQMISTRGAKQRNAEFHEYFQRKVAEGKKKAQAIVCIQRRLINILYGLMKRKTPYRAAKG